MGEEYPPLDSGRISHCKQERNANPPFSPPPLPPIKSCLPIWSTSTSPFFLSLTHAPADLHCLPQQTLPRDISLHFDLFPLPHPTSVGVLAKREARRAEGTDRGRLVGEADVEGYAAVKYVRCSPFFPSSLPFAHASSSQWIHRLPSFGIFPRLHLPRDVH